MFFSLSSGEDHLEKLAEMERLLAQAQTEKMHIIEEQVSMAFTFLLVQEQSSMYIKHVDGILCGFMDLEE